MVRGHTDNGRIIVESLQDTPQAISVKPTRVQSLALVPLGLQPDGQMEVNTSMLENFVVASASPRLDEWINLPGLRHPQVLSC